MRYASVCSGVARQVGGTVPGFPALQGVRKQHVRKRHALDRNAN